MFNETGFASKIPKLKPKLVSVLSERNCLFRLFRLHAETASFGVSIEPKHKKAQVKQTTSGVGEAQYHGGPYI